MNLDLDDEARRALDRAKRSVPADGRLEAATLAAALLHEAGLAEAHADLAQALTLPPPLHSETPERVRVAPELLGVLRSLEAAGGTVTAERLLEALLSDPRTGAALRGAASRPGRDEPGRWRESARRREALEALSRYGRLLTTGEEGPGTLVGMEGPLRALVRTLSKMKRRNALVVGPPGCGKSALVYELARRIATGHPSIPEHLRDHDIFELSPSFLRAGASMVGQYDERLTGLLKVLEAHPRIILFVDEIHSLLQSGMHERTPFSEANESLKAALARGTVTCIGCTTSAEYRHYIEPDGALARRFAVVRLEAPTPERTVEILVGRRPRLEAYYDPLRVPDRILELAVELTERYLPGRYQPDASIQLLDEACAYCITERPELTEVTEEALWTALEDMAGHSLLRARALTEEAAYEELARRIVGQEEALRRIARILVAGLSDFADRGGPRAVICLAGPTGVGKTATAEAMARLVGGGREALIRVDCNTLRGGASEAGPARNQLLGPPPGYIGYVRGQGGILSRIRDVPECIVLFDEVEKAGRGVTDLILQLIDDGRLEDSEGNLLDFRRAFVVLTTNAGGDDRESAVGFATGRGAPGGNSGGEGQGVRSALVAAGLPAEFVGRIRHVIPFRPLSPEAARTVVGLELERLREVAAGRGLELEWGKELIAYLLTEWQPRFGARHLKAMLQHRVLEQLGVADAQGELGGVGLIRIEPPRRDAEGAALAGGAARSRRNGTLVITVY